MTRAAALTKGISENTNGCTEHSVVHFWMRVVLLVYKHTAGVQREPLLLHCF